MQWRRAAVLVGAGSLAIAAACGAPSDRGGDAASEEPRPTDTTPIGQATDPDAKAPAPEVPDAQRGGIVTVQSGTGPDTLDPTRAYFTDATAILHLVTRGLTQYQYRDGQMVLVPDMAVDLGKHNADFTEWTFDLRAGLAYEDGSDVRAADIAHAVKRQFAVEELPDGPTYGLENFLAGNKYVGPFKPAKKAADGTFGGEDFPAVEAPDDDTVVIKTRKPFPDMPYYASFPNFTGIPAGKDTREDYGNHPLATGPYRFEKYTPGKELVLVRNEHWDPSTDTTRHQYVDGWNFKFAQDPVRVQQQLIADSGPDQTSMTYDDILAESWPKVKGTPAEQRVIKGRQPCVSSVYLDTRKIPLAVRKALAVAYPIESLAKVSGRIPGLTWSPAKSLMPSVTPGWQDFDAIGNGGTGDGDPAKAKRMLKKAGHLGFEISYAFTSNDPISPKVSTVRKEKLEAAGFTVKARPVPIEQARQVFGDPDAPMNIRTGASWCTDWPSGATVFPAQWYPPKIDQPGVPNPSFLDKPELTRRIDEISAMPPDEGLAAWGDLDRHIMEKYLPVIPIGEGGTAPIRGSRIANAHIDEAVGMPDFTQMYLKH